MRPPIRRSKRWSMMGSCGLGTTQPGEPGQDSAGTQSMVVSCPDDFFAVRVGLVQNYGPAAFDIPMIKAVASTGFNDGLNPIGEARWVTLTAACRGADSDRIVTARNAPRALPMPAAAMDAHTGRTDMPKIVWTDWTQLRSTTPDADGLRWCFIRQLLPAGFGFSYVMGNFPGLLDGSVGNQGNGYCMRPGNCFLADYVTDCLTAAEMPLMSVANTATCNYWAGSPIGIIQFMTVRDGVTIMGVGDSHHAGVGSTGDANGAVFQAASAIGRSCVDRMPVGIVNAGWPGANADQFFAAAMALLASVRPAVVVLPGWTFNQTDREGRFASAAANECFLAQLLMFADQCAHHGAAMIFTTPFPRDPETMAEPARLAAWHALRHALLDLRDSGATVIDVTPNLSAVDADGTLLGSYLPGLSDDGVHPNDHGHAVVAKLLRPILQDMLGLPRA